MPIGIQAMKLKRRQFLGTAVASTAGAIGASELLQAAPTTSDNPTGLVPLGKELKVCRIGIGTGVKSCNRQSNATRMAREKFDQLLRDAYDQGIRLFDLADLYGSHPYVARVLKGKPRDSYQLSSKVWFHPGGIPDEDRGDADVMVKRFLKELNTDYLDLVQIHCMSKRDWPAQMRKQMDLLAGLKQQGVIRAHGVSCHAVEALEAAAEEPWVDVVHARINPDGVKMDGPAAKVVPAMRKIHAAGKGLIAMKIIGEGAFGKDEKKRQQSVRFVMGLGCVDVMIVGFEKKEEILEFKTRVGRLLG